MELVREHDIPFNDFKKYLFHEESNVPEGYVGNSISFLRVRDKGRNITYDR